MNILDFPNIVPLYSKYYLVSFINYCSSIIDFQSSLYHPIIFYLNKKYALGRNMFVG